MNDSEQSKLDEEAPFLEQQPVEHVKVTKRTRFQVKKIDNHGDDSNGTDDSNENGVEDTDRLCDDENVANSYDTQYLKSLRYYTREPLPRAAHYRNTLTMHTHHDRPSLDQLHDPSATISPESFKIDSKNQSFESKSSVVTKLGWIKGVFVRCLLNIWGVMLFLRLPWAVGQAGILNAILIMLLATLVTVLTTVSMSAICTNGEVKGGGAYYMISRSLGPEFGGAIGAIFALANAVAIAMYVVGFCETVIGILIENNTQIVDGGIQDVRIIGVVIVTVLLAIAIIGMEWESKAQQILLIILLAAMGSFVFGVFTPTTPEKLAKGFMGMSSDLLVRNFLPDYRGMNFIEVFAVIFPAATGILAGANISGDLVNPSKAIPKGTFLAILVTTFTYIVFMILCGVTTLRDANGLIGSTDISEIMNCSAAEGHKCRYGLHNSDQVIVMISPYSWIIYAGIFAASLSSALASLVSAPKIFQALCNDNLFPFIHIFGKGYGPSSEPRRAYFLAYLIAVGCILIGQLNLIAPIISNFFLAAYCIVNFSCFHVSFTKSPGFRPAFRWYNKWISLIGAFLCFGVMLVSNWSTAVITIVLVMFLYIYILYRKPDVNWGSSDQAGAYMRALRAVKRTVDVPDHVKNYRPQILVLSGVPSHRPAIIDFANLITKKLSLLICGDVHTENISAKTRRHLSHRAVRFFSKRKLEAFYELKQDKSFADGARALMELSGLGKLRPNILLIGYKTNWFQCPPNEILDYFRTIHSAFDLHLSVCVLRVPGGFDFAPFEASIEQFDENEKKKLEQEDKKAELVYNVSDKDIEAGMSRNPSGIQLSNANSPSVTPSASRNNLSDGKLKEDGGIVIDFQKTSNSRNDLSPDSDQRKSSVVSATAYQSSNEMLKCADDQDKCTPLLTKELLWNMNQFNRKQRKGTIDVWWLYDDGGLTMLIPYLLSTRSQYENCILRVFTLANRKDELDREKRNMAALLSKFRIDFQDVTVVPDIIKPPKPETVKEFESLISKFTGDENQSDLGDCLIRDSELKAMKDKNNRHIRLRELLLQHSSEASLIVMTLTIPRKGRCSAPLFLAWLEMLTKDMPPFLLVRGNQSSVLTFYS